MESVGRWEIKMPVPLPPREGRTVLHFHRQTLVATMRSHCWLLGSVPLDVLNPQISHLMCCHVRTRWVLQRLYNMVSTNCLGMCEQRDVTEILIDNDCFKEFTGGATAHKASIKM